MGLGTVGLGVAQALAEKADEIASRVGRPVVLQRALVRDLSKARDGAEGVSLTTSPDDVTGEDIDVVVEVIGGETPALELVQRALHRGKHVVTANKELMAKHGPDLLAHAAEHGVALRFEASVGGGIPIIAPLLRDLLANRLTTVHAIINGTTNFMLTRMAREGQDYESVLAEAQRLGYAEPDPAADVDGIDAAYKLAVLASLAFHTVVRADQVYHEGIRRLTTADFRYAAELGYGIRLLAIGRLIDGAVQARVHPAFIPVDRPLAKVEGVLNAVELEGDLVGWTMFVGPGAGPRPTSSAVVGDIVEIARSMASGSRAFDAPPLDRGLRIATIDEVETQYYIRLRAIDRPGVMATVAGVLGELDVSLASVIQKEPAQHDGSAEIVATTHNAKESAVRQAVERIAELEVVSEVSNVVRIEEGKG